MNGWRAALERQKRWNAVDEAVRRQAGGKSRDEVRQLLLDEIQARGLPRPVEPLLEMRLGWIYVGRSPIEKLRLLGELVGAVVAIPLRLKRMLDQAEAGQPVFADDSYVVPSDPSRSTRVVLDRDAERLLEEAEPDALVAMRRYAPVMATAQPDPADKSRLTVLVHGQRVGFLAAGLSAPFRAELAAGESRGSTPLFVALRTRSDTGDWRLDLLQPSRNHDMSDGEPSIDS